MAVGYPTTRTICGMSAHLIMGVAAIRDHEIRDRGS